MTFKTVGNPVFDLPRAEMWAPLLEHVAEADAGNWMFMMCWRLNTSRRLFLYKHKDSRHYLNIDDEGVMYEYDGARGVYSQISEEQAIVRGYL